MIHEDLHMKYVIGFLRKDKHMLLIKRNKQPWLNKWNGVGGKIDPGESPLHAIQREIWEETTLNLKEDQLRFAGIVTWESKEADDDNTGMYAFIAELADSQSSWPEERTIGEGILSWKTQSWIYDKKNKEIADNVPAFLSLMMDNTTPKRYHCVFRDDKLQEVKILPLPKLIQVP